MVTLPKRQLSDLQIQVIFNSSDDIIVLDDDGLFDDVQVIPLAHLDLEWEEYEDYRNTVLDASNRF